MIHPESTYDKPTLEYNGNATNDKFEVIIKDMTIEETRYLGTILTFRIGLARYYRQRVDSAKKEGKKARLSRTQRSILRTVEQGDVITIIPPPDDPDYEVYNSDGE